MPTLSEQIKRIAENYSATDPVMADRYLARLSKNAILTRDEGAASHICTYFLPYNPTAKQVFIVRHKKSGLWLSPGGHMDKDELILDALNREISEELGVTKFFPELPKPFLLSITPIDNPVYQSRCKEHLDIWFLLETDGNNFNVDPSEFHEAGWMDIAEAKQLLTDPANLQAMDILLKANR